MLRLTELSDAEELFLTNLIVGVQPVRQVDGENGELPWQRSVAGGQLTRELATGVRSGGDCRVRGGVTDGTD